MTPTPSTLAAAPAGNGRAWGVVLIAILSLALAALTLLTGALLLMAPVAWPLRLSMYWLNRLGFIPHSSTGALPATWILFSALMVYTLLFILEGGGMLLGKAWAEYLVLVELALLLPPEIDENFHHADWLRLVTLGFNIFIFLYLVYRRTRSLSVKR